ncbi:hypothetical protein PYCCODRAFT_1270594 [Trametes coccinea BRFM310]|uniref:Uncharacterized protein n=1 Tax=Trametes coccinea (strain BRFM310) TaxID=1353009 RepID=A0A1Y2IXP0_TRAC3|nr:hypothetical protein PYCCODRAFT_1270594 [Trametes coccinea BRFM310]
MYVCAVSASQGKPEVARSLSSHSTTVAVTTLDPRRRRPTLPAARLTSHPITSHHNPPARRPPPAAKAANHPTARTSKRRAASGEQNTAKNALALIGTGQVHTCRLQHDARRGPMCSTEADADAGHLWIRCPVRTHHHPPARRSPPAAPTTLPRGRASRAPRAAGGGPRAEHRVKRARAGWYSIPQKPTRPAICPLHASNSNSPSSPLRSEY